MAEMHRLRAIVDAGVGLASELSLDAVLQRIVEAAADLTGARYPALGVIDQSGRGLEEFVVTGIDEETQAAISDPPHGRGILGAMIQDAKPLRLDDLADDPRSVEALTNVVKHAQARHVSIVLTRRNGAVAAVIEDDGRGFDEAGSNGLGLLGMQERAGLVGGRLEVESSSGSGTTLSIEVPVT